VIKVHLKQFDRAKHLVGDVYTRREPGKWKTCEQLWDLLYL